MIEGGETSREQAWHARTSRRRVESPPLRASPWLLHRITNRNLTKLPTTATMAHVEPATTTTSAEPLTQEQIWDDSTLISTWDAALEEYKKYHSITARGEDVEEVLKAEAEAEESARDEARLKREAVWEEERRREMEDDDAEMGGEEGEVKVEVKEEQLSSASVVGQPAAAEAGSSTPVNPLLGKLRAAMAEVKEGSVGGSVQTSAGTSSAPTPQIEDTESVQAEASPMQNEEAQVEATRAEATPQAHMEVPPGMPAIGGGKSAHDVDAESARADFCGVADETMRNLMMSWYWAGYYTGLQEGRSGK